MMRKKKRQSEREAELALRNGNTWAPNPNPETKDETEAESSSKQQSDNNEVRNLDGLSGPQSPTNYKHEGEETGKGAKLDLNCQPRREREDDLRSGLVLGQVSMMNLLRVASQPLETYLKQNGLMNLSVSEQQAGGSPSHAAPEASAAESEDQLQDDLETVLISEVQQEVEVAERGDATREDDEDIDEEMVCEEGNVADHSTHQSELHE